MNYQRHHPRRSPHRRQADLPYTDESSRNPSVHVHEGSGTILVCDPDEGSYQATFDSSIPIEKGIEAFCQGLECAVSGEPPNSSVSRSQNSSYATTGRMRAFPTISNGYQESRYSIPGPSFTGPPEGIPREAFGQRPRQAYRPKKPYEDGRYRHDELEEMYRSRRAAGQEQNNQVSYEEQPFDPFSQPQEHMAAPPSSQSFHQGNSRYVNNGPENWYYGNQGGFEPLNPQGHHYPVNGEDRYSAQTGCDAEEGYPPEYNPEHYDEEIRPHYWT